MSLAYLFHRHSTNKKKKELHHLPRTLHQFYHLHSNSAVFHLKIWSSHMGHIGTRTYTISQLSDNGNSEPTRHDIWWLISSGAQRTTIVLEKFWGVLCVVFSSGQFFFLIVYEYNRNVLSVGNTQSTWQYASAPTSSIVNFCVFYDAEKHVNVVVEVRAFRTHAPLSLLEWSAKSQHSTSNKMYIWWLIVWRR